MNSEKKAGRTKVLASRIVIFIPIVASLVAILKDGPSVLETYFDKNPSKETAQQQSEVTEETRTKIDKFMMEYNLASVSALNHGKFAEVEDYLDPKGEMYDEQLSYIMENSNSITPITQKNTKTVIENTEEVSSNRYIVSTYEEYDIYKEGHKNNRSVLSSIYSCC